MTPQQALALLDSAAASVAANRADHVSLQEAVKVLAALIPSEQPAPAADLTT